MGKDNFALISIENELRESLYMTDSGLTALKPNLNS